eukprot:jgi/Psemu1/27275/gm1.27275_g
MIQLRAEVHQKLQLTRELKMERHQNGERVDVSVAPIYRWNHQITPYQMTGNKDRDLLVGPPALITMYLCNDGIGLYSNQLISQSLKEQQILDSVAAIGLFDATFAHCGYSEDGVYPGVEIPINPNADPPGWGPLCPPGAELPPLALVSPAWTTTVSLPITPKRSLSLHQLKHQKNTRAGSLFQPITIDGETGGSNQQPRTLMGTPLAMAPAKEIKWMPQSCRENTTPETCNVLDLMAENLTNLEDSKVACVLKKRVELSRQRGDDVAGCCIAVVKWGKRKKIVDNKRDK